MVNELNKPQDNAALSELHEMQEEHRQLQAELTRLSAQRQQLRMATREVSESIETRVESRSETACPATPEGAAAVQTEVTTDDKDNASDEDKEETANYLQQKLAEIANLKAQFKRVQQITDSTKLIEQHMSTMESKTSSSSTVQQSRQTMTAQSVQSSSSSSSTRGSAVSSETATSVEPTSGSVPDNAELLNAMINMVTDFTSDLRGQEESLRTERLRIKTLKEEIIQRKQGK
ncbi:osteocalcin 2 isoform X2 [Drosophila montana]|uniref:osteocalcin 2 isoform X2 n=1 Tax=Drosophila montana TaxID=40370 RepID=UPI00313DFDE9